MHILCEDAYFLSDIYISLHCTLKITNETIKKLARALFHNHMCTRLFYKHMLE